MEGIISNLVGQFENGKLTRRQLVETLAMAVAGSPGAISVLKGWSAEAKPLPLAPWKTVWLDHISFQVADYRRSADFYSSLMGWRVTEDTGKEAVLDINGIGGIIIRNHPGGGEKKGSATSGLETAATGTIDHISWGVEPWDTDAVRHELETRHLNPEADMDAHGFESFHVKDPDGWDLQISNQTREHHELRIG
jgi:catechol 2,3-dioxygenase-like lactoylglutathione lyase family enzyme